ncbi:MAG: SprT family zinc-dependent metalloprotease [Bacteroidota bacterium]
MVIEIGGQVVPCKVEKSYGSRLGLRFAEDEPILLVSTPSGQFTHQAEAFIQKKTSWILKHFRVRQAFYARRLQFRKELEAGRIFCLGKNRTLEFQEGSRRWVKLDAGSIRIQLGPEDNWQERFAILYGGLRALAKEELTKRTRSLAAQTDSQVAQIRIKDHKSKWGSCSGKRNINLNWHLILLPEPLVDYVIIHELMHLREMNHSQRFWDWVAHFYPAYKKAEAGLKDQQWLIGIFAADLLQENA